MRAVEVAVAVFVFAVGAVVVYDSYRLGSKWGSDGPQSGYFPFYIGLLICISSAVNLGNANGPPGKKLIGISFFVEFVVSSDGGYFIGANLKYGACSNAGPN